MGEDVGHYGGSYKARGRPPWFWLRGLRVDGGGFLRRLRTTCTRSMASSGCWTRPSASTASWCAAARRPRRLATRALTLSLGAGHGRGRGHDGPAAHRGGHEHGIPAAGLLPDFQQRGHAALHLGRQLHLPHGHPRPRRCVLLLRCHITTCADPSPNPYRRRAPAGRRALAASGVLLPGHSGYGSWIQKKLLPHCFL